MSSCQAGRMESGYDDRDKSHGWHGAILRVYPIGSQFREVAALSVKTPVRKRLRLLIAES